MAILKIYKKGVDNIWESCREMYVHYSIAHMCSSYVGSIQGYACRLGKVISPCSVVLTPGFGFANPPMLLLQRAWICMGSHQGIAYEYYIILYLFMFVSVHKYV